MSTDVTTTKAKSPLCIKWADQIIEGIVGGASLKSLTDNHPEYANSDRPSASAFLKWVIEHDEIAHQYARAMAVRADQGFEEMLELAEEFRTCDDMKDVMALRGLIDTKKWWLARVNPRKYGEKLDLSMDPETAKALAPVHIHYHEGDGAADTQSGGHAIEDAEIIEVSDGDVEALPAHEPEKPEK